MSIYYQYPLDTNPLNNGQWWLPGLGGDPVLDSLSNVEQGIPRLRNMYKDGTLLLDEAAVQANQAFFEWWKLVDPVTLAANTVASVGEVAVAVPRALFLFWQNNQGTLLVPAKLLGQGMGLETWIILGVAGVGLYLFLKKPAPTLYRTIPQAMPASTPNRRRRVR